MYPTNRLAQEKSPYLLQHKNNPVNWYPWGNEAFEAAKREDMPVLLSIGYSTCHWCHVMAHESFEDAETAEVLNAHFICIKVDREERPDIDAVYMKVCQAMTGSGGWPLTVFLTPEQKPFYAGTYFPKHSRYGQPGLMELALRIAELWENDRPNLLRSSAELLNALSRTQQYADEPSDALSDRAFDVLRRSFDAQYGGFGSAPKFPTPHRLLFLMQHGDTEMSRVTLEHMARGGICDQIGGGFSRYATDSAWRRPHFEKMLYDNALLILAYSEAYARTGSSAFSDTAQRTADYLLRELRSPEGAFFCGQDADSEGVEGGFYTFSPAEIVSVLGAQEGEAFCRDYAIRAEADVPSRTESGAAPWDAARLRQLYDYRKQRRSLHTDDKILLSWNAWTMLALVKCGRAADAVRVRDFIEHRMTDGDGRLYLRYRDGEAANDGQLDDYAVYALALLALYRETLDVQFLEQAVFRAGQLLDFFEDDGGGYFLTAHDAERLILRGKESYDGAMPSGNAAAGMVLEQLAQLTGERVWREAADRQMRFLAGQAAQDPAGHCFGLLAIDRALHPAAGLVVCGRQLPDGLKTQQNGSRNVLFKSPDNAQRLAACAPFTAEYPIPEDGTRAYLCENGACRSVFSDLSALTV